MVPFLPGCAATSHRVTTKLGGFFKFPILNPFCFQKSDLFFAKNPSRSSFSSLATILLSQVGEKADLRRRMSKKK